MKAYKKLIYKRLRKRHHEKKKRNKKWCNIETIISKPKLKPHLQR